MKGLIKVDPNRMSLGELSDLEEFGKITMEAFAARKLTMRSLTALAWIIKRREDPSYTLEQARSIKVEDVQFKLGEDEEDPPTSEATSESSAPSA